MVVSMVLERRLLYQLKVADVSRSYCAKVQAGINGWLKNRAGVARSFPNAVWFGSSELGGIGEHELADEVNIEKILIFLRGMVRGATHQDSKFLELEEIMTQEKGGEVAPVFNGGGSGVRGGMGTWGCSMGEFLHGINATIPGGGELPGRRHCRDWAIVSLASCEREREILRAGCNRYRVWWGSYLLDCSGGERWRWGLGSVYQEKRRREWELLILNLGSVVHGERGGAVLPQLRLGVEGWLPINYKQEGECYAGRDANDRSRLIIHEVLDTKQGVVQVRTWVQKWGSGIGKNKSVAAKEEWEWLASEWEEARLLETHWERSTQLKKMAGTLKRVELWVSRGGSGAVGQVISKAEYSFQPGQYARGREMVQRFRRCDVRERRTRELTLLAGVGMEEVNWWEQEFDSVWLFSDGSVREDEERTTYAWTVRAWNGENKRELCWGGGERVGVAGDLLHSCGVMWTVGWTVVNYMSPWLGREG